MQGQALEPLSGRPDGMELRFHLAQDTQVHVVFRGRVTQEAIEMLIELLRISRRAFPKASVPQEGSAADPTGPEAETDSVQLTPMYTA